MESFHTKTLMNPTMLFIEDDEDDVYVLQNALERGGIQETRHFVSNGKMAIEYLQSLTATHHSSQNALPQLILLDLNMPLMNGMEFLQWRQQQAELHLIPVVVLTSSQSEQDIMEAYRLGANAYLVKPMSAAELTDLLKAIQAFWLRFNRYAIW